MQTPMGVPLLLLLLLLLLLDIPVLGRQALTLLMHALVERSCSIISTLGSREDHEPSAESDTLIPI